MELIFETLTAQKNGRRSVTDCSRILSPPEKYRISAERFNRFSRALADAIGRCPGEWSCVRCEGKGSLLRQRFLSCRLDILLFREGTLRGLCRICHNWDLASGTILRLSDIVTNFAQAKAALSGWEKGDWYFDESGVHLYICNFNPEKAEHYRASRYTSFLQDTLMLPAFFKKDFLICADSP